MTVTVPVVSQRLQKAERDIFQAMVRTHNAMADAITVIRAVRDLEMWREATSSGGEIHASFGAWLDNYHDRVQQEAHIDFSANTILARMRQWDRIEATIGRSITASELLSVPLRMWYALERIVMFDKDGAAIGLQPRANVGEIDGFLAPRFDIDIEDDKASATALVHVAVDEEGRGNPKWLADLEYENTLRFSVDPATEDLLAFAYVSAEDIEEVIDCGGFLSTIKNPLVRQMMEDFFGLKG